MSQFTDYAENQLIDRMRGQAITLPTNWYLALLSAADDDSQTEIVDAGLERVPMPRDLVTWSGTQGAGSTLASYGTSHRTSNNVEADFGVAVGSGSIVGIGFFDDDEGGNCWAVWEPGAPIEYVPDDPVVFAPASIAFTLGITGGMTDFLANVYIDNLFRGEDYEVSATMHAALFTASPSNAGGGTEVGGGVGYARAEFEGSLTSLAGTQGEGTTLASSGTSGQTSNNVQISHPAPTGNWGTIVAGGWLDAATGGNLLWWAPFAAPRTISADSPAPVYEAGKMTWSIL